MNRMIYGNIGKIHMAWGHFTSNHCCCHREAMWRSWTACELPRRLCCWTLAQHNDEVFFSSLKRCFYFQSHRHTVRVSEWVIVTERKRSNQQLFNSSFYSTLSLSYKHSFLSYFILFDKHYKAIGMFLTVFFSSGVCFHVAISKFYHFVIS